MMDDTVIFSVDWLRVPVDQLKSRLSKVNPGVIKACCDLYLSPKISPKSKTARYDVIAKRFRCRSVLLFSLTDVEFFKDYFALFPLSSMRKETGII